MKIRMGNKGFTLIEAVIGIAVILALAAAGFYFATKSLMKEEAPQGNDVPAEEENNVAYETFVSEKYGLSFKYPKRYFLTEQDFGDAHRYAYAIVLTETDPKDAPEGGEGPVSITINMFQNNLDKQTAEKWIKGMNNSNYKLSPDGKLAPVSIGGEDGLAYRVSGLYEMDTAVVARPNNVYMFSGAWMGENDPIRKDFADLLGTVMFLPDETSEQMTEPIN